MPTRPLLLFPRARVVPPPPGRSFPRKSYHFPGAAGQQKRINAQLVALENYFQNEQAQLTGNALGIEPESVLVIETIGSIEEFKKAVERAGLEFLGEWDVDDIEPDDEFYEPNKVDQKTDKKLSGRVFLTMTSQQGLDKVLSLWNTWKANQTFPLGQTKWRDVFKQLKTIRRWDMQDRIQETGLLEIWKEDLQDSTITAFPCHIELWYRQNDQKRQQAEGIVRNLIAETGGLLTASPLHIPEIHLHALKAELSRTAVEALLGNMQEHGISLFKNNNVMFYRPTGQCTTSLSAESEAGSFEQKPLPSGNPVAAIFDGMPMANHQLLQNRLIIDDADDLAAEYQQSERRHGTAMASLVVHGELDSNEPALDKPIYFRPVMQSHRNSFGSFEWIPHNIFYEDLIHRAVRRMFEGEGEVPPQASTVKVINLSIGDPSRPFLNIPSPWARLLDWLSWKYKILFCISSGNFNEPIPLELTEDEFKALSEKDKISHTLKKLAEIQGDRRIISPAESMNGLTVGSQHFDLSLPTTIGNRLDILPDQKLPSPISRSGHGFRRSIKPDILLPGGKQLYNPPIGSENGFKPSVATRFPPGQRVAADSPQAGQTNHSIYTSGTSNAAALATRSAALIHDVIQDLRSSNNNIIEDGHEAVLLKALLVHGATWNGSEKELLDAIRHLPSSEQGKRRAARYLGYGFPDINRVLECTEQRATALGCGYIEKDQIHEYRFPLPPSLSGSNEKRRLTITLAWFSPINPGHRNLRRANLSFDPPTKGLLPLSRQQADHNQVKKGTVQHEILEGAEVSAFDDDSEIVVSVRCKADAGDLSDSVPYGLAVTLEVAEGIEIPIYQQVSEKIALQIRAETVGA